MTPLAWLFAFLLAVALVALIAILILLLFATEAVRNRQLKKRAKRDYEMARGTAHRKLLENAERAILERQRDLERQREKAQRNKEAAELLRDDELIRALKEWLVQTRLQEISGIGPVLSQDLYQWVYGRELSDLRQAHRLRGIGYSKQANINLWVSHYESLLPSLIRTEQFPARKQIEQKYRSRISKHERVLTAVEQQKRALETRLQRIREELDWLQSVTAEDFVRAYHTRQTRSARIVRYWQGVFAEWEPVPDWFHDEVSALGV